ncbi:SGNH/GDSL hydrolase family protein [Anaerocolumna chitinilytica]|uniref:SGNH hydrolase-type esterase domain-containing protein n=1 Tax=Anaerocolumna chitinilytica TaxID=1727145 RepID=A0A7M3SAH4_9FIRM|nr:GDSL-type esterase/lipase family protein [Anaerocolumna chitinilytica]BCK01592.1 hypothetical protein bsdcttw_46320 [Anaerocolumna chitinilytica]
MDNWQTVYVRINWVNNPNTSTALGATNLNKMDLALSLLDGRVISLNTTKLDIADANSLVADVTLNNGVFTILKKDGSQTTYDTKIDKIAVNMTFDAPNQRLVLHLEDGTEEYVDMSSLITEYEFEDSSTIAFTNNSGKVSANIKNGSVTAEKLQPDYLADITVQANIATAQAEVSTDAAEDSLTYRDAALAAKTAAELARDQAADISNVGIAGPNKLGLVSGNGNAVPDSLGAVWVDSSKDKATLTGSSVQFTNADDALIALSVKCKSTQTVTTQGKQLFDKAKVGTVKYINPNTGVLTTSTYNNNVSPLIAVTAGQSVTISGHTFVQPNTPVGLAWHGPTGAFISGVSYQNATGNGTYLAPAGTAYVRDTVNNVDLNTSQMEIGTVATPYAAFVPTSPSLDYPAPITSTGDGGSFVAVSNAKNWLDITKIGTASSCTRTLITDGANYADGTASTWKRYSQPIQLKPNTTYVFKANVTIVSGRFWLSVHDSLNSSSNVLIDGTQITTSGTYTISFTTNSASSYYLRFNLTNGTATTADVTLTNAQIEPGTATPYEAYKGNTITVNSGGYSTSDGTADVIDLPTKKKTANCAKIVYNGSESGWSLQSINSYGIANFLISLTHKTPAGTNSALSNILAQQFTGIATTTTEGFYLVGGTQLFLRINQVRASTVTQLQSLLAATPMTLIYQPTSPVTTDITATPSNYLTSYKGITNVFTTDATQPTLTAIAKSELWARDYLQDVALADIKDSNVTFTDAVADATITSGSKISVIIGLIKFKLTNLLNSIGTLSGLLTTAKSNLVAAINENTTKLSNLDYIVQTNPDVVCIGDSLMKGGTYGNSMAVWISMLLKKPIINNAVWGRWTVDVKTNLKTDVLDLHPKKCLILMGTNDVHGGATRTTTLDNYEYVIDTLIDNHIEPIVISIPPRGDYPSDNAAIRYINSALLFMCQKKMITFVDIYNPLANSDGTVKLYMLHNADNLHFSTYGGVIAAKEVVKSFTVPTQNNDTYTNIFKGEYPLIENGIFTLDSNSDGLANNWTAMDTANTVFTLSPNPKGGNYQTITKSISTALLTGIEQTIGAFSSSNQYHFECDIDLSLSNQTDTDANLTIYFTYYNSSSVVLRTDTIDEQWYATGIPNITVYKDFTPPVGTASTKITIRAIATSPFVLKIGRAYANILR